MSETLFPAFFHLQSTQTQLSFLKWWSLRRLHRAFHENPFGTPLGECGLDNEVVLKLVVCVLAIYYLSICWGVFFPEAFIIFILPDIVKIAMERHVCNCRNLCANIQNLSTAKRAVQVQNSTHWAGILPASLGFHTRDCSSLQSYGWGKKVLLASLQKGNIRQWANCSITVAEWVSVITPAHFPRNLVLVPFLIG